MAMAAVPDQSLPTPLAGQATRRALLDLAGFWPHVPKIEGMATEAAGQQGSTRHHHSWWQQGQVAHPFPFGCSQDLPVVMEEDVHQGNWHLE